MNRIHSRNARGFSLLEVLVAVVIMTVGLLALASLQLSLVRSGAQTKAQTVAMGLAKEAIEDSRAFTDYADYQAITDSGPTNIAVGGITYTLTETVTRYVYDNDAVAPAFVSYNDTASLATLNADTAIDYLSGRDFKKITAKVTWVDSSGSSGAGINTVFLDDAIDWLDPADTARLAKKSSSTNARNAEVIIKDPSTEAGVIPIAIGDDKDTAATNPRPEINSSGTETRFDILTYSALSGNSGLALAQSRVETTVIKCTCDTDEAPTGSTDRGYRPTYFNGTRYVAPTLTTYVPPAGQDTSEDQNESPYCFECCRDHHDPASVIAAKKPRFDPWRAEHSHWYADDDGVLHEVDDDNTSYDEACRLIRVDGIFRVAADFNDEYFNLLEAKNDGTSDEFIPTETASDHYVAMVLDYLTVKVISTNDTSTDPTVSNYNDEVVPEKVLEMEDNNAINDPATIGMARTSDHKWLHSRGLYVDYLETEALEAIARAKSECDEIDCDEDELEVAVLSVLPFTSINLTELSEWSPPVEDNAYISATNGSFFSQSGTDPVRGKVVPEDQNIPAGSAVEADGVANMRKSNSAIALTEYPIDEDEDGNAATGESDEDIQVFEIAAGGAGNAAGTFQIKPTTVRDETVYSGGFTSNCTGAKVAGKWVVTCNSNKINVEDTITAASYNYQSAATAKVTGAQITCTHSDGTAPLTYTVVNADPKLFTCFNYKLDSVTSSGAATIGALTVTNNGKLAESTSVSVNPINQSDILTFTFSADTTGYGYSCVYTAAIGDKTLVAANCK